MYSEQDAIDVTRALCKALAKCHLHQVVHLDLKPENVLYQEKEDWPGGDVVKICDFGTACFLNDAKSLTVPKGTPAFMAPEILSSSTVAKSGPEADVWSLGATLYNLVCGRQPFSANDYLALVSKVRDDQLGKVFSHDIKAIGVDYRLRPATEGPSTAR